MKLFIQLFLPILIALALVNCSAEKTAPDNANNTPLVLQFIEQEKGIEPYPVRMIVTDDFMRVDDGNANDDFLLLDRKNKTVYSITHETSSYYQFESGEIGDIAATKPKLTTTVNDSAEIPLFQNKKTSHTTYLADGESCYDVISVNDLHDEAVEAMREYLLIMSRQHTKGLERTPAEFQQKCMLANFVFAPTQYLENGFPLREWDYRGYSRSLVDFKSEAVDSNLFQLPQGYEKVDIGL